MALMLSDLFTLLHKVHDEHGDIPVALQQNLMSGEVKLARDVSVCKIRVDPYSPEPRDIERACVIRWVKEK